MGKQYFDDQDFEQLTELPAGDYDNCTFRNCVLTGQDLGGRVFADCTFMDCDLSNIKLLGTGLQTINFERCKLLAVRFEDAADFLLKLHFKGCNLELATFQDWALPKTKFQGCRLLETDFTGANLQEVVFADCDLLRTIFMRTDLRKADFRTAINYRFSPEDNRLRGALFSSQGLPGLLAEHGIIVE